MITFELHIRIGMFIVMYNKGWRVSTLNKAKQSRKIYTGGTYIPF